MFEEWTGEGTTKYTILHHADLVDEWEVVSDVSRQRASGVKTFRNSCGRFDSEEKALHAKQKLEGIR